MAAASAPIRAFRAEPYDYDEVRRLATALELAEPVAVMLVRRGYRSVQAAREFLEARDQHDPDSFEGMAEVCERVLAVARRGGRVTVHGDYDVDGVCSTAILVAALRELGAECDWLIPDRLSDGYGLTLAGVERLRARGTEMMITVDCGISSAPEVAAARAAGLEVIVTDHHEPPKQAELPECPILHPVVSGYPFSGLCAAAVAHKLASALHGGERARDLDLVALATVADLVPLVWENRRLVRAGLARMRSAPRPGLRALMAASRVDPETLDEGALGFRLAPRINAAGRLYRADAGVELMLTDDGDRAGAIAEELDRANSERRAVEREVTEEAEAARRSQPASDAEAPALVLAGEGWHSGVLGIAASRLAELHWRPTVLLSLDGERARGSARSIPGFDLIAALDACSDHLLRHGGHRAAAGLELPADGVEAFREAFLSHAAELIGPEPPVRTENVDALVGVGREGIGMQLASQLERLAPFGKGNPGPRLVVPSARLGEIRPLGETGRHSRFQLRSGAGSAAGVAFGMNDELEGLGESDAIDASVRLELDRWNGAVSPRVVLRELYPVAGAGSGAQPEADRAGPPGCGAAGCPAPAEEWWRRFASALQGFEDRWPVAPAAAAEDGARPRELVDRRRGAAVAALAELVSSGDSVLALCADAARRRALVASAADPRRFGGGEPRVACGRCGEAALDAALGGPREESAAPPGLTLADWGALARRPAAPRRFAHVVLVDPPPFARLEALARAGRGAREAPPAPGYLHLAWGPAELELAERCAEADWELRGPITEIWRAASAKRGLRGERLRRALAGGGRHPRTPEVAARCARVLVELGLCELGGAGAPASLRVLSSQQTELTRSRAYAACGARHEEAKRYLRSRGQS